MPSIRRTIQRGRNAWIEEVKRPGVETGYFVGCMREPYNRSFDHLTEAEAFWREAEDAAAPPSV